MARTREFLKNLVSSRIDEVIPVGNVVQGQTAIETPIDAIEDELDFSAEFVTRVGSIELLFPALVSDLKMFHDNQFITQTGDANADVNDKDMMLSFQSDLSVIIPVPEDFLRFVSIKLNSSKKEVTELISSEDPEYRLLQNNPYTSGTRHKPKAALISFSDYNNSTDFFKNGISNSGFNTNLLLQKHTIATTGFFITNQDLATLNNSHSNLSTNDKILLVGQTNTSENGVYLVLASGSPKLLSKNTNSKVIGGVRFATGETKNSAIHYFKANSTSDSIEKFHYIPKMIAEDIPDTLTDPLVYHCAGRVLESLQRPQEAQIMYQKANTYLTVFNDGLIGK
tara:strand:+ start:211 stop:1227 length:1017 start_codon:yes stop_codon:yes gene_type:complete